MNTNNIRFGGTSLNKYVLNDIKLKKTDKEEFYTPLDQQHFSDQYSEIFIIEEYKPALRKKDMVILDIGANMGLSILYFAPYAKMVYGLEPSAAHYKALEANVKDLTNVKIYPFGISSHTGKDLLISNGDGFIPESIYGDGKTREEVEMVTLDKFMADEKIDHVDVMKIDTEGSEYEILTSKGFLNVADKIDFIIGEGHYLGNLDPRLIPLILAGAGFETKFLPIKNITRKVQSVETGISYEIGLETLFIAERKRE